MHSRRCDLLPIRRRVFTGLGALATAAALTTLAPGTADAQQWWTPGCVGLECVAPGSPDDVPQARDFVPSVAGPEQLERQATAGFYEFGAGTDTGNRAVAYVVPLGQADKMPSSVRDLPEAVALAESGIFHRATVVIFEPDTSLVIPNQTAWSAAVRRAEQPVEDRAATQTRARAAAEDFYGCSDNHFCIYNLPDWGKTIVPFWPGYLQLGPDHTGEGFKRLGNYSFNDITSSMRNRRDRDSLLAEHWNGSTGTGTRYCADSHSSDGTLSNNAIGDNSASAFANVPDDAHC